MASRELTGRHVAIIFFGAFGIIISVNLALAFNAVATFPGLETKNSYVVSQKFDAAREAQLALGWTVTFEAEGDHVRLSFVDEAGRPLAPEIVSATLGRATHVKDDRSPEFAFDGRGFVAPEVLAPGNWNLRLVALSDDGTEFRQRIPLWVKG